MRLHAPGADERFLLTRAARFMETELICSEAISASGCAKASSRASRCDERSKEKQRPY